METTGAITFKFPSPMVVKARPAESNTPLRGFWALPAPLAKGSKNGKIRSPDNACKIRGAPKNDAIAEDKVAAITPALMRNSTAATRFMDPYSPINVSLGRVAANTIAARK